METETMEPVGSGEPSFLVQMCQGCGTRISLDEGDVIFGGEWFHRACWNRGGAPDASPRRAPANETDGGYAMRSVGP